MTDTAEKITKKAIACPHCGELLGINIQLVMSLADPLDQPKEGDDLSDGQKAALGKAKQSGVFQAFLTTFNNTGNGAVAPYKADRAFLLFFSRAQRKELTPDVLRFLYQEYELDRNRDVYALVFNHVAAIAANGKVVAFYPVGILIGRMGKNVKAHSRRMPDLHAMVQWKRGRFGYVPADANYFATEMTKKSIGAFANIGMTK